MNPRLNNYLIFQSEILKEYPHYVKNNFSKPRKSF